jgi:hypothetical protein
MDIKRQGQRGPDKCKRKKRQDIDNAKVMALRCQTILDEACIAGPDETAELIRYTMANVNHFHRGKK